MKKCGGKIAQDKAPDFKSPQSDSDFQKEENPLSDKLRH